MKEKAASNAADGGNPLATNTNETKLNTQMGTPRNLKQSLPTSSVTLTPTQALRHQYEDLRLVVERDASRSRESSQLQHQNGRQTNGALAEFDANVPMNSSSSAAGRAHPEKHVKRRKAAPQDGGQETHSIAPPVSVAQQGSESGVSGEKKQILGGSVECDAEVENTRRSCRTEGRGSHAGNTPITANIQHPEKRPPTNLESPATRTTAAQVKPSSSTAAKTLDANDVKTCPCPPTVDIQSDSDRAETPSSSAVGVVERKADVPDIPVAEGRKADRPAAQRSNSDTNQRPVFLGASLASAEFALGHADSDGLVDDESGERSDGMNTDGTQQKSPALPPLHSSSKAGQPIEQQQRKAGDAKSGSKPLRSKGKAEGALVKMIFGSSTADVVADIRDYPSVIDRQEGKARAQQLTTSHLAACNPSADVSVTRGIKEWMETDGPPYEVPTPPTLSRELQGSESEASDRTFPDNQPESMEHDAAKRGDKRVPLTPSSVYADNRMLDSQEYGGLEDNTEPLPGNNFRQRIQRRRHHPTHGASASDPWGQRQVPRSTHSPFYPPHHRQSGNGLLVNTSTSTSGCDSGYNNGNGYSFANTSYGEDVVPCPFDFIHPCPQGHHRKRALLANPTLHMHMLLLADQLQEQALAQQALQRQYQQLLQRSQAQERNLQHLRNTVAYTHSRYDQLAQRLLVSEDENKRMRHALKLEREKEGLQSPNYAGNGNQHLAGGMRSSYDWHARHSADVESMSHAHGATPLTHQQQQHLLHARHASTNTRGRGTVTTAPPSPAHETEERNRRHLPTNLDAALNPTSDSPYTNDGSFPVAEEYPRDPSPIPHEYNPDDDGFTTFALAAATSMLPECPQPDDHSVATVVTISTPPLSDNDEGGNGEHDSPRTPHASPLTTAATPTRFSPTAPVPRASRRSLVEQTGPYTKNNNNNNNGDEESSLSISMNVSAATSANATTQEVITGLLVDLNPAHQQEQKQPQPVLEAREEDANTKRVSESGQTAKRADTTPLAPSNASRGTASAGTETTSHAPTVVVANGKKMKRVRRSTITTSPGSSKGTVSASKSAESANPLASPTSPARRTDQSQGGESISAARTSGAASKSVLGQLHDASAAQVAETPSEMKPVVGTQIQLQHKPDPALSLLATSHTSEGNSFHAARIAVSSDVSTLRRRSDDKQLSRIASSPSPTALRGADDPQRVLSHAEDTMRAPSSAEPAKNTRSSKDAAGSAGMSSRAPVILPRLAPSTSAPDHVPGSATTSPTVAQQKEERVQVQPARRLSQTRTKRLPESAPKTQHPPLESSVTRFRRSNSESVAMAKRDSRGPSPMMGGAAIVREGENVDPHGNASAARDSSNDTNGVFGDPFAQHNQTVGIFTSDRQGGYTSPTIFPDQTIHSASQPPTDENQVFPVKKRKLAF